MLFEDVTEKPIKISIYYNAWGVKAGLDKTLLDSVQLIWNGLPEDGEDIPLKLKEYLGKKAKKEGFFISFVVAITAIGIAMLIFAILTYFSI